MAGKACSIITYMCFCSIHGHSHFSSCSQFSPIIKSACAPLCFWISMTAARLAGEAGGSRTRTVFFSGFCGKALDENSRHGRFFFGRGYNLLPPFRVAVYQSTVFLWGFGTFAYRRDLLPFHFIAPPNLILALCGGWNGPDIAAAIAPLASILIPRTTAY